MVERADVPGGRAGLLERDGFRFDTGPTVLTMVDILARTFEAAGADMADFLTLHRLDPLYRATFADGSTIRVRSGRDAMAQELRDTCGPGLLTPSTATSGWVTELYELEMPNFIDRDFDHVLDLARPIGPALRLARMGGFANLSKRVARYFDDERLQRLFSFQAMYAGLAPQRALALYAVISYMDSVAGVYYPQGGMHAVPVALAQAVEKAGGELRYGAGVERIVLADGTSGAVRGVRLDGGELVAADAVVATPDLPAVYRSLLPGMDAPRASGAARYSPSALVRHAGVRGLPGPEVAHHNIHFGYGLGLVVPHPPRRRAAHARPVDPRHRPHHRRSRPRPRRLLGALRPRAGAQPRRPGRLDHRAAPPQPPAWPPTSPGSATRATSWSRRSSTPSTGSARAWSGARRSR